MAWTFLPGMTKPVWQDDAGDVHLLGPGGKIQAVKPEAASKLLGGEMSDYRPAGADELNASRKEAEWENASLGAKAGFVAREGVKNIADTATGAARAAFGAGMGIAKAVSGSTAEVANPLEALSGESLVEGAQGLVDTPEGVAKTAAQQRRFAEAAPGVKFAADVGGMLAGGAALKGLGAAGELASGVGLLGEGSTAAKVGSLALENAAQSYAIGAEDAWVQDVPFTSEAAMGAMGVGALLGGGLGVAGAAGKAGYAAARKGIGTAKTAMAERVFGSASAGVKQTDKALESMAADVVGSAPPKGFVDKFKDVLVSIREGAEDAQSLATGVDRETLRKYGPMHWDDTAVKGREAYANRAAIREGAATELTDALQTMRTEGDKIHEATFRVTGAKERNIAPLLTGDAETMMARARAHADDLEIKLKEMQDEARGIAAAKKEARAGGVAMLAEEGPVLASKYGDGASTAHLRTALKETIDKVRGATAPNVAVNALDAFKANMDKAKMSADAVLTGGGAGVANETLRGQVQARSLFAKEQASAMRSSLEDASVWGKFGDVQKRTNKAWSDVLGSDEYLSSHLLTKTGRNFDNGRPILEADPMKMQHYVDGLGTTKTRLLDPKFRESIAARRELASAITEGYGLAGHEAVVERLKASADKAQDVLKRADEHVGTVNAIETMIETRKGHSSTLAERGAGYIHQAMHFRGQAAKMTEKIDGAIKGIVDGTSPISKAAKTGGTLARGAGRAAQLSLVRAATQSQDRSAEYNRISKGIVEAHADPIALSDNVADSVADFAHDDVRDAVIQRAGAAVAFMASKMPASVYAGTPLTPSQLQSVAPAQQAKFLRYYEAVNDPSIVFDELKNGNVPPEHMEALKAVYPAFYRKAQLAVMEAVADTEHPMGYQQRLALAELFDEPGLIEPTLDRGFMDRISAAATEGAKDQAAPGGQPGAPARPRAAGSVAKPMQSHLSTLSL